VRQGEHEQRHSDSRMKYQEASSKPPLCGRGRPEREYSAISSLLYRPRAGRMMMKAPGRPAPKRSPSSRTNLSCGTASPRPEIHQQDPMPLSDVIEEGRPDQDLHHPTGCSRRTSKIVVAFGLAPARKMSKTCKQHEREYPDPGDRWNAQATIPFGTRRRKSMVLQKVVRPGWPSGCLVIGSGNRPGR